MEILNSMVSVHLGTLVAVIGILVGALIVRVIMVSAGRKLDAEKKRRIDLTEELGELRAFKSKADSAEKACKSMFETGMSYIKRCTAFETCFFNEYKVEQGSAHKDIPQGFHDLDYAFGSRGSRDDLWGDRDFCEHVRRIFMLSEAQAVLTVAAALRRGNYMCRVGRMMERAAREGLLPGLLRLDVQMEICRHKVSQPA